MKYVLLKKVKVKDGVCNGCFFNGESGCKAVGLREIDCSISYIYKSVPVKRKFSEFFSFRKKK
jgi:hypothetical protein